MVVKAKHHQTKKHTHIRIHQLNVTSIERPTSTNYGHHDQHLPKGFFKFQAVTRSAVVVLTKMVVAVAELLCLNIYVVVAAIVARIRVITGILNVTATGACCCHRL